MSTSLIMTRSVFKGLLSGSDILITLFIPSTEKNIDDNSLMVNSSKVPVMQTNPLHLCCGENDHRRKHVVYRRCSPQESLEARGERMHPAIRYNLQS